MDISCLHHHHAPSMHASLYKILPSESAWILHVCTTTTRLPMHPSLYFILPRSYWIVHACNTTTRLPMHASLYKILSRSYWILHACTTPACLPCIPPSLSTNDSLHSSTWRWECQGAESAFPTDSSRIQYGRRLLLLLCGLSGPSAGNMHAMIEYFVRMQCMNLSYECNV